MFQSGIPEFIIIPVGFVYGGWRLVAKTGHPGLVLLLFVPLVNLGFLLYLAFGEWPIERELRALRQQSNRSSV